MIQRLYIHNFRCLENFELNLKKKSSALLIGKNGSGKSTVSSALEIFQKIARGQNKTKDLLHYSDFVTGQQDQPIRLEVEALIEDQLYHYDLALELPDGFREFRIYEESLSVSGKFIFERKFGDVTFVRNSLNQNESNFVVDWHLVALPVIQEPFGKDPISIFKTWLSHMIILQPIPSLMGGESRGETLQPVKNGSDFEEWFTGLLSRYPAAYTNIHNYLKKVMPDFKDFQNELVGRDAKSMSVRFSDGKRSCQYPFSSLSDGEKCYFLCALVAAANEFYGPLFCFWDEPDSYLSLSEVSFFINFLRKVFENKGQILVTSHNPEAIRKFSENNTWLLFRKSHLEPTQARLLEDLGDIKDDIIEDLTLGDIEL